MDDGIRENDGRRDRDRQGRVIVGVDGSLGSLGALRRAVAEARRLGRQRCASSGRRTPGSALCHWATRTWLTFASRSLVGFAGHEDDLLVVGAGAQGRWRHWWHGSVSGYCVRHARCPVLIVPLPEFARTMRRARLPRRPGGLDELLDA